MSKLYFYQPIIPEVKFTNEPFGFSATDEEYLKSVKFRVYKYDNSGKWAMPETYGHYLKARRFVMSFFVRSGRS